MDQLAVREFPAMSVSTPTTTERNVFEAEVPKPLADLRAKVSGARSEIVTVIVPSKSTKEPVVNRNENEGDADALDCNVMEETLNVEGRTGSVNVNSSMLASRLRENDATCGGVESGV